MTGFDLSGMPSLCGFDQNIVKQRPGLEILLQDNAASLEEQMDGEDEAYEELARTLICEDYFTLRRDGSVGENELRKELFMQLPA